MLKLRAHDTEDLSIVSACLQDALVHVRHIAYLKREKRFVMVVNRFRWEGGAGPEQTQAKFYLTASAGSTAPPASPNDAGFEDNGSGPPYERVNCGLCFDRVRAVRVCGLRSREQGGILNLLAIESAPGAITLVFSGSGRIRLETQGIRCHLEDLGEPWPTAWRPSHSLDDSTSNA
jgi:hypothetical protein